MSLTNDEQRRQKHKNNYAYNTSTALLIGENLTNTVNLHNFEFTPKTG